MENIQKLQKLQGVDVRRVDLEPLNGMGRIGASGIDKNYSLNQLIELAYGIKANIIVKAGKNAKWYLKRVPKNEILDDIEKQGYRDTSRYTMWIIEWDNRMG